MTQLIGSADLPGLVTATSDALGIPPADIEKDIWVVEVLRSVFRPVDGARVIFKGGTSLSKAYGIIERFSEDVDLLVVPENALSRGGRDRVLREIPSRAARDLDLSVPGDLSVISVGDTDLAAAHTPKLKSAGVAANARAWSRPRSVRSAPGGRVSRRRSTLPWDWPWRTRISRPLMSRLRGAVVAASGRPRRVAAVPPRWPIPSARIPGTERRYSAGAMP